MSWDPTQPVASSLLASAPMRGNFQALDASLVAPLTALANGQVLYKLAGPVLAGITPGATGTVLTLTGTGTPTWLPNPAMLSPMTTAGDLIVGGASGTPTRLGIGAPNQVLTMAGGVPVWQNSPTGFTNPMTTPADLIVGGVAGAPLRLGIGANTQVLTVVAGVPTWVAPASGGMANPMTTLGDLIQGGASGAANRLPIGANTQVLTVVAGVPTWQAPVSGGMANPMTTLGDLIQGGASGAANRLAIGTTGQVLKVAGGVPTWSADVGFANPMTTLNDMIVGGAAGVAARLAMGANGQYLGVSGGAVGWVNGVTNVLTTTGDLLTLDVGAAPIRLPIGSAGQVLMVVSGAPTWSSSVLTNPMTALGDLLVGLASGVPSRLGTGVTGPTPAFVNGQGTGTISTSTPTVFSYTPGATGVFSLLAFYGSNIGLDILTVTAQPPTGPPILLSAVSPAFASAGVGAFGMWTGALVPGVAYTVTVTWSAGGAHACLWISSYSGVVGAVGATGGTPGQNPTLTVAAGAGTALVVDFVGAPNAGVVFSPNAGQTAEGAAVPDGGSQLLARASYKLGTGSVAMGWVITGVVLTGASYGVALVGGMTGDGNVLTLANSTPAWRPAAAANPNPMTTRGDLIVGATAGIPSRLGVTTTGPTPAFVNGLSAALAAGATTSTHTYTPGPGGVYTLVMTAAKGNVFPTAIVCTPTSGPTDILVAGFGWSTNAGSGFLQYTAKPVALVPGITYTIAVTWQNTAPAPNNSAVLWIGSYSGVVDVVAGSIVSAGFGVAHGQTVTIDVPAGANPALVVDFAAVRDPVAQLLAPTVGQTAETAQLTDANAVFNVRPSSKLGTGTVTMSWPISAVSQPSWATFALALLGGMTGDGNILTLVNATPAWLPPRAGNPMTAQGDLIVGGVAGVPTRLAPYSDFASGRQGVLVSPAGLSGGPSGPPGWSSYPWIQGVVVSGDDYGIGLSLQSTRSAWAVITMQGTVGGTPQLGNEIQSGPGGEFAIWNENLTGDNAYILHFDTAGLGTVRADPTAALGIATKQYVDGHSLGNPMTSVGDLILGGAAGVPTRLGMGTSGYVLGVSGGTVQWVLPTDIGFANPMTTAGDVIIGGSAGVAGRLGIGSSAQVLTVVSGAPAWAAPAWVNPMTTAGDLIIGGVSGAGSRLGIGSTGQVLRVVSGTPAWQTPAWVTGTGITDIVALTQAAYDALSPPVSTTLYVITP